MYSILWQKETATEETAEDVPYSLQTSPAKNVSQEWTSVAQPASNMQLTIHKYWQFFHFLFNNFSRFTPGHAGFAN